MARQSLWHPGPCRKLSFLGPVSEVQRGTRGGAQPNQPTPHPPAVSRETWGAGPEGSCVALIPLARGACSLASPAPSSGPPAGADPARPPGAGLNVARSPSFRFSRAWLGSTAGRGAGRLSELSPAPLQTELHRATEVVFFQICRLIMSLPLLCKSSQGCRHRWICSGAGVAAAPRVWSHERF